MISDNKIIQIIINKLVELGMNHVVISPGSRNAPLSISFHNTNEIKDYSIVDERSAGFVALGMAMKLKKPVVLVCTSGTAVLNYAPAIAEAFHSNIPLFIITADRPQEWLFQGDGQTINQSNIFNNYIKFSVDINSSDNSKNNIWYTSRMISQAYFFSKKGGPVHVNIHLEEPLYGLTRQNTDVTRSIDVVSSGFKLPDEKIINLANCFNGFSKVLILGGCSDYDLSLTSVLDKLSKLPQVAILTETTTNLRGDNFIKSIDCQLAALGDNEKKHFQPQMLITFGGQVVSKQIKKYLREYPPEKHWHISKSEIFIDTYMNLSTQLITDYKVFFEQIINNLKIKNSNYNADWNNLAVKTREKHNDYLNSIGWCDLKVYEFVFNNLPENTDLHLANSTPVRYSQLFQYEINIDAYSNRGTSGIDGSVSTAVGSSLVSDNKTLVVTGDLSFFYDSNALWNNHLLNTFKIIVVNNQGGGIFNFIPGPDTTDALKKHFVCKHDFSAKHIAKAYNVEYFCASDFNQLNNVFSDFINNEKVSLLEINTPENINGKILRGYFDFIKKK